MPDVQWTRTTTGLLAGLAEPGNEATWREFDARYRPVIVGLAIRMGLGAEDAADVAQETLSQFVRDYRSGKYDRTKGRLRAWVLSIARHRVLDTHRARGRRKEWRGESGFVDASDEPMVSRVWDEEMRRAIYERAMGWLREETRTSQNTLRAFEMFALSGVPAAEVSRACGVSVAEVYRIKNRVAKRLREIVEHLTAACEAD